MRFSAVVALAAGCALAAAPASASPIVQTFVLAVGGEAAVNSLGPFSCATGGSQSPHRLLFGSSLAGVPTEGPAACGLAGGFNTTTAASGPLSDTRSLSTTFSNTNIGAHSFTGEASANAQYGKIGAEAHGTYTGAFRDGFTYDEAEGSSLFTESFTVLPNATHLSGTPGAIHFTFAVDGSLSSTGGRVYSHIEVVYQQDSGSAFTLMRAQVDDSTTAPFIATPSIATSVIGSVEGFALALGSVTGSGDFTTFELPFVYGTAFDFTLALAAGVAPIADGSSATADFASTALLTGIGVSRPFVEGGQPVADFSILSGSGTIYDANGVHLPTTATDVPEPASLALLSTGLLGFYAMRRRRNR
jgi:hypothetical protein